MDLKYNNDDDTAESAKYPGFKRELYFTKYYNDTSDFARSFRENLTEKYYEMKIIVLDKYGNLLAETDQFGFEGGDGQDRHKSYVNGTLHYDMDNDVISISRYYNERSDTSSSGVVKIIFLAWIFVINAAVIILVTVIKMIRKLIKKKTKNH